MSDSTFTAETLTRLRQGFLQGTTLGVPWRRRQLDGIRAFLRENRAEILAALAMDLGKPGFEAHLTELAFVETEIAVARRNLRRWSRPRRVGLPWIVRPGRGEIQPTPLGIALILSPWNYPLQLALVPLVSALAAGNGAVLKPSELAPACSHLLAARLPSYLDGSVTAVVSGDAACAAALTALPFDKLFFTGSPSVGRRVMAAAAAHLTPLTLELGGKSPCIVDATADVAVTARRIVWGKFLNAGQTCVAPDYVLVERSREPALIAACVAAVRDFWGSNPQASRDYGRIVNPAHVDRLVALLDGATILVGGGHDRTARYLAPTIVTGIEGSHPLMREEIFGPILPILAVDSLAAAVAFVNARPSPLALYLFSRCRAAQARVVRQTRSGGVCINDVIMQLVPPKLPFGGVGASGMGACHGRAGFDAFTHFRSVLNRGTRIDPAPRYPPHAAWIQRLLGFREASAGKTSDLGNKGNR